jgi:hypothetical protein
MPKLLIFSDLHANLDLLTQLLGVYRQEHCDGIIVAGDLTHFDNGEPEREILPLLLRTTSGLLFIHGNADAPPALDYFRTSGHYIHNCVVSKWDMTWIGYGNTVISPFHTFNEQPEETLRQDLDQLFQNTVSPVALLAHHPPAGILDLTQRTQARVGSAAVRSIMEKYKPMLVICGHIHESPGIAVYDHTTHTLDEYAFGPPDLLQKTIERRDDISIVINATAAKDGHYAILTINDKSLSIALHTIS